MRLQSNFYSIFLMRCLDTDEKRGAISMDYGAVYCRIPACLISEPLRESRYLGVMTAPVLAQ